MLSHKDKLAVNLRRFYGAAVANMIHPEAYVLRFSSNVTRRRRVDDACGINTVLFASV